MPRISAASLRFHRVRVSIRRISSRSASRAAERAMSLSETFDGALAPAGAETAETEPIPIAAGAAATATGAAAATAGGGMTGCSGGGVGRGAKEEEDAWCGQWWSGDVGC